MSKYCRSFMAIALSMVFLNACEARSHPPATTLPATNRLFQSGFETGNDTTLNGTGGEWSGPNSFVSSMSYDTTVFHGGAASLKLSAGGVLEKVMSSDLLNRPAPHDAYYRFYLRFSSLPTSDRTVLTVGNVSAGLLWNMRLRTDGLLGLFESHNLIPGSLVGTSSTVLSPLTWHLIEVHLAAQTSNASHNGVAEIKVDGVTEFLASDLAPGAGSMDWFEVGLNGGAGAVPVWIDDVAVNRAGGSVNGSWCGPGQVNMLVPIADVTPNVWLPSNGTDHWAQVGEAPSLWDDAVGHLSTTMNGEDRWALSALPVSIPLSTPVNALCVGYRCSSPTTSKHRGQAQLRDVLDNVKLGLDEDFGARFGNSVGVYGTDYPVLESELTWDGTSQALTASYVNGMKAAVVATSTGGAELDVTGFWVSVDVALP